MTGFEFAVRLEELNEEFTALCSEAAILQERVSQSVQRAAE